MEADRLDDARRSVTPVVKEAGDVSAVRELAGQIQYLLGQWKRAAAELETFRMMEPDDVTNHPVLADCYRALGRHVLVDELWSELKAASPAPEVMAEGRVVVAGSLADRGEMTEAISLLVKASRRPPKVRVHHLRQWYALADLYDRAGNPIEARRWFREVARVDPTFVDVAERLAALGR
jgi:tetratricopeptide (TPR) repeat protein